MPILFPLEFFDVAINEQLSRIKTLDVWIDFRRVRE